MKLVNNSDAVAGYRLGSDPAGAELLIVALKRTYSLGVGRKPQLSEVQLPLCDVDEPIPDSDSNASVMLREHDWAPGKPHCDISVHGLAHAPEHRPTTCVVVGLRFGDRRKHFAVVGNRCWIPSATGPRPSAPEPFVTMETSYTHAFGGPNGDPINPCGRGYFADQDPSTAIGCPLPNTEDMEAPVCDPRAHYRPMSLGVVGRNWWPRLGFAGSFDERWRRRRLPLLPNDFQSNYHQCTAEDQWVKQPHGREPVSLTNFTSEGNLDFEFPTMVSTVEVTRRGVRERQPMVVDTVLIEPEEGRMAITARAVIPVVQDPFEFDLIAVTGAG